MVILTWSSHALEINLIIVQNRSSCSFITDTNLQLQNKTSNTHETVSAIMFLFPVPDRIKDVKPTLTL